MININKVFIVLRDVSLLWFLFLGIFTSLMVDYNFLFHGTLSVSTIVNSVVLPVDEVAPVGCGSNSMGLTLKCNDLLYMKKVGSNDRVFVGRIYTYDDNANGSVVHRLVACVDVDCNLTVFKGDNNNVAEFVNRSKITAWVVRVEYD